MQSSFIRWMLLALIIVSAFVYCLIISFILPLGEFSIAGDVRFMDIRNPSSVNTIQTSQAMTAMAVHPKAHVFAW